MTIQRDRLMDVLDKAHRGPIVKQFDWDTRVIPGAINDKLKKYNLQKACDEANPVNQDLELADRFFQAGLDVAAEVGMLCTDTQRAIRYSREELLAGLEAAPEAFSLGEGDQTAYFRHRAISDPAQPIWVSPLSIAVRTSLNHWSPVLPTCPRWTVSRVPRSRRFGVRRCGPGRRMSFLRARCRLSASTRRSRALAATASGSTRWAPRPRITGC